MEHDYENCVFISDGTYFDKDTEATMTTYLGHNTGLFTGIINGEPCNRVDGEMCHLSEFWIKDKTGKVVRNPYNPMAIPHGLYCYNIKQVYGNGDVQTIPCQYYKKDYCTYLSEEIDDQCKICEVNMPTEEDLI